MQRVISLFLVSVLTLSSLSFLPALAVDDIVEYSGVIVLSANPTDLVEADSDIETVYQVDTGTVEKNKTFKVAADVNQGDPKEIVMFQNSGEQGSLVAVAPLIGQLRDIAYDTCNARRERAQEQNIIDNQATQISLTVDGTTVFMPITEMKVIKKLSKKKKGAFIETCCSILIQGKFGDVKGRIRRGKARLKGLGGAFELVLKKCSKEEKPPKKPPPDDPPERPEETDKPGNKGDDGRTDKGPKTTPESNDSGKNLSNQGQGNFSINLNDGNSGLNAGLGSFTQDNVVFAFIAANKTSEGRVQFVDTTGAPDPARAHNRVTLEDVIRLVFQVEYGPGNSGVSKTEWGIAVPVKKSELKKGATIKLNSRLPDGQERIVQSNLQIGVKGFHPDLRSAVIKISNNGKQASLSTGGKVSINQLARDANQSFINERVGDFEADFAVPIKFDDNGEFSIIGAIINGAV